MKKLMFAGLLLGVLSQAQAETDFSGTLYRRGTQQKDLVFTLHAERGQDLAVDRYFDAKGADAIIERVFLKEGKPWRYEFDDKQQGGMGSVEVQGSHLRLRWNQDGKITEKITSTPDNLTFGPLYPTLLQAHFDDLLTGKKILATVPVLSQNRLMTAELAFQRKPQLEHKDGKVCFSMKPANWFVALFFPPIDLYFDEKSKTLTHICSNKMNSRITNFSETPYRRAP